MASNTNLEAPRSEEFARLLLHGMKAKDALDMAFGEGAFDHLARKVWLTINAKTAAERLLRGVPA